MTGMRQVAFGEAGSQIIGQNLNVDGDLDYMVSGRKMSGIFGFAMVRNFVECTECLQVLRVAQSISFPFISPHG